MLNEQQQAVVDAVLQGKNIFLTGLAGSGKSFLLHHLREILPDDGSVYFTATTGVASGNVCGQTIHRFSGLGIANRDVSYYVRYMKTEPRTRWLKCKILIIDEVSMLSGEMFSKLYLIAQRIRGNLSTPFGGIQLILVGDFHQLPPIVNKDCLFKYPFQTPYWHQTIQECFYLTQVYRQESDETFLRILNEVRQGEVSDETFAKLQTLQTTTSMQATKLFCRNIDVDAYNRHELSKLDESSHHVYPAFDDGDTSLLENLLVPETLELRLGARVMLLFNIDIDRKLYNGSQGIVTGFLSEEDGLHPKVLFQESQIEMVITQHVFVIEDSKSKPLATRHQYPLKLSYACTIHKTQGLTIDALDIDFQGVFENGQVYVALSRGRKLENILIRNLTRRSIRSDPIVKDFYARTFSRSNVLQNGEVTNEI